VWRSALNGQLLPGYVCLKQNWSVASARRDHGRRHPCAFGLGRNQDKPILGILNLVTGETRYEQGEAVFSFLQPWLSTLAARVVEKRQPLYRLDPAEWEVHVISQFGQDKQLPKAAFPGLSLAQQHRVYAKGRALDHCSRTAIQGEPGTGKVRCVAA
jgi:hypothetical protein